jgi:FlaA1/EpsC-like NDP-sugar epimerase
LTYIDGSAICITGGTGSLGTALVSRLLSNKDGKPASITVFSRDELKQANMKSQFPDKRMRYIIGDMKDYHSVLSALSDADIVFNAAAMKRVETCEKFPDEAIAINYGGASNIVRAIKEGHLGVETVVNVGSDKGCSPSSVYGETKSLQESRLMVANSECPHTRFIGVRYGNVMASRGSVIPIWQNQVKEGNPVTVTDPNMTRFLISLDQAVDTLLMALNKAEAGEIYIPQLPAAKIGDIAKAIIGKARNPILITGKGQAEKMHETLVTELEANRTKTDSGYYVVTPIQKLSPALIGEYVSKDYLIGQDDIRHLLLQYGLIEAQG